MLFRGRRRPPCASTSESVTNRRRPDRTLILGALVLLLSGVIAGCSTNPPQAILNVPGNYVANLWATPSWQSPTHATVLMCLGEASAVHLETGDGGEGSVGSIKLQWAGTTYSTSNQGDPVTLRPCAATRLRTARLRSGLLPHRQLPRDQGHQGRPTRVTCELSGAGRGLRG
ncbi:MAG: hypothetical protein M5U19_08050 [Microthrixaceae bacterium]|nr:hypothetical protein [Microthrixaceae bacterium]